jgi:hypothetical protein
LNLKPKHRLLETPIDVDLYFFIQKTLMSTCFFRQRERGSHVYASEINTWLWNFGRPQPRVGGLSVAKSSQNRKDPQAFQVRNVPARLEGPAGPEACSRRGRVQLKTEVI